MAKKTLVISPDDWEHFSLVLRGGTLIIGDTPEHASGVLRGLHVSRVRCEIEVADDAVSVNDQANPEEPAARVHSGDTVRVGRSRLQLVPTPLAVLTGGSPASGIIRNERRPTGSDPGASPVSGVLPKPARADAGGLRLRVFDGADQGRSFPVPASGTVTLGKSPKHADIVLNDLYVARVHCQFAATPDGVVVTHVEGEQGTRIDGTAITAPTLLLPGAVLRVGNSHLRLEVGPASETLPDPTARPAGNGNGHATPADPPSGKLKPPPSGMYPGGKRPADPLSAMEGQMLGHYRLGTLLGRGHTGAVYDAHDKGTGLVVALKVIAPEFPSVPAELERFARVVKAAMAIHHPHLVAVHAAGKTGAHCWVAREFVEGESAAAVIQRVADGEKPSWTRACRVAVHLARALADLHGQRLIHGNVTPRNVLVRAEDHVTKLTDLKMTEALDGSKFHLSILEKKLLAELPYLAPEQTEPGAFVDHLADLYAIGAVAYALVAGRPPVSGKTPAEVLAAIQGGRVVKPSTYYKKVPATFEGVVLKLLACHQEDRYQSAAALAGDLTAIAKDHDITL